MRKKSFVWNHYTMASQGTKATCHHCKKEISYSLSTMSNLGRHIKLRHPEVFEAECAANESTMELFSVEEIGEVQAADGELKTYEITVKGFEEMEDISSHEDPKDPDWTPDEGPSKDQPEQSSAGTSSQRKDRKRSEVWNHFQQSLCKTSATCLYCNRVIRMGTISNLARHLRNRHPNKSVTRHHYDPVSSPNLSSSIPKSDGKNDINEDQNVLRNDLDICSEVIELNVDNFQNPGNVIEMKVDESRMEDSILDGGIITQSSQTEACNVTEDFDMHDYIKPKKTSIDTESLDRQLIKMIVKGCHPVSMVEQSGFKQFVNALNPDYELPSLNRLTQALIPECYRQCEARASKSLKEAEGVCLYIDQLQSRNITYMCITAHFINKECKFERLFLACHVVNSDENASDISQRLHETATEWEIFNKIVAVVTDNTEIITEAIKLHNWVQVPHFIRSLCHSLHEGLQVIKSLVNKVKNIIEELKKSPHVVAEVYSNHKMFGFSPVKLVTKVNNNWNSSFTTLEMLSRFVKLRSALIHVSNFVADSKLTENEWRILKSVVEDVLHIFKEVKQEVTKEERVCMSKIVFYINSLKREMGKHQISKILPKDAICVATVAQTHVEKHFGEFLNNDLVSFILLLDPRLKRHAFNDESEYANACSKLKKEVCEVTVAESEYNEPDPKSLWFTFDEEVRKLNGVKDPIGKGILELENYLQEQLQERDKDPLVWWEQRKAIYPRLFKLMKKYLCVSSKSAQRESISYKTAYMLSQLRNSDSTCSESELMFLHHNM